MSVSVPVPSLAAGMKSSPFFASKVSCSVGSRGSTLVPSIYCFLLKLENDECLTSMNEAGQELDKFLLLGRLM